MKKCTLYSYSVGHCKAMMCKRLLHVFLAIPDNDQPPMAKEEVFPGGACKYFTPALFLNSVAVSEALCHCTTVAWWFRLDFPIDNSWL